MSFNVIEIDGVVIRETQKFPVEVTAEAHDLGDTAVHRGKLLIEQLPDDVMLLSQHHLDPHTMIIDGRNVSVDGAKLDTIESGAQVNNLTNQQATSLTSGLHTNWHHHDNWYYRKTELQTSGESQVHWGNITNKPIDFTPSEHDHNDILSAYIIYMNLYEFIDIIDPDKSLLLTELLLKCSKSFCDRKKNIKTDNLFYFISSVHLDDALLRRQQDLLRREIVSIPWNHISKYGLNKENAQYIEFKREEYEVWRLKSYLTGLCDPL